ncbi:NAD-dependent epimerase/dehydratase family protein [Amycolatopsis alba]|uniref:Epimerase n=1 Tax=Amycolatopsis alba DSM 44262 TaxID=1125972 RepID=A0A229REY1_AMYAL|nr:NAD-dependent epimerase/dehydratase family protein [Amycolatopsis alba]OXM45206.1 epimerase [Amycolatopsis alba DSM 44262]
MKVAVTGATSDFGAAILPALCADPEIDEVIGLGRRPPRLCHPKLRSRRLDVRSPELAGVFDGCEAVLHLAFVVEEIRDKAEIHDINLRGSRNVIDSAARAGVERLVVASSVNAYGVGDLPKLVDEDVFPSGSPDHYYFYDKAEVEHYAEWWLRRHPGEMAIALLRSPYVIGPSFGNDGIDALTAPVLMLPEAGRAGYQFLHQRDLADAFHRAAKLSLVGPYNLGTQDWISARDLARMHGQLLAGVPEKPARRIADVLFRLGLFPASGQWVVPGDTCVDGSRFRAATGWAPALTSSEAAAIMVLHKGRPVLPARYALSGKAACERALEPATEILAGWVETVGGIRALVEESGGLEKALGRLEHVQRPVPSGSVHLEVHPAEGVRLGTVVVSAGPGLHARWCTPLAMSLARHGVEVVLVDLPGHGLSTGRRGRADREAVASALAAAIRYASTRSSMPPYLVRPEPVARRRRSGGLLAVTGQPPPPHVLGCLHGNADPLVVRRAIARTAKDQAAGAVLPPVAGVIPVAGPSVALAPGGLTPVRDAVLRVVRASAGRQAHAREEVQS